MTVHVRVALGRAEFAWRLGDRMGFNALISRVTFSTNQAQLSMGLVPAYTA